MAEHDDETTDVAADGDELLREAERLRSGAPATTTGPEPAPTPAWTAPAEVDEALDTGFGPRRTADAGALLIGLWFVVAGVFAAVLGDAPLDDLPPVLVPISFAVVGLGLLLPKRARR